MSRSILTLAVLLASALAADVASAQVRRDYREDRFDRREDYRDAREDYRDSLYYGGPADRIEDRRDHREDIVDSREDARDAANVEWWRGYPAYRTYVGPRNGYYFAPGYGYYAVPVAYRGRAWVRGVVVPVALRRYPVVDLALYRLPPPPPGHGWYHIDNDIVLISLATGVILDAVFDLY